MFFLLLNRRGSGRHRQICIEGIILRIDMFDADSFRLYWDTERPFVMNGITCTLSALSLMLSTGAFAETIIPPSSVSGLEPSGAT